MRFAREIISAPVDRAKRGEGGMTKDLDHVALLAEP
jgi:hypothetical protein